MPAVSLGSPDTRAKLVFGALALTAIARVVAAWIPSGWLWGIDTLRYWPPLGQGLIAVLLLAGFAPPIARPLARGLERIGSRWERAGGRGDLAVGALAALALFALRDPVRFTGDSMMRAGLIELPRAAAGRLMGFYFPLDDALNLSVPRWLLARGLDAATGLQLVGAIVGGAYAFVSLGAVRALGARGASLAAAGIMVLAAGTLVHFAGYDKFGPLMLGIALAARGAVRLARTGEGLGEFGAGTVVALLAHRSGYFLLPATVWTLVCAYRIERATARRWAVAGVAVLVAGAALVMLPRTVEVATRVDLAVHLPGGAVTRSREAAGMPVVLAKLLHVSNAILFLVPLALAGLAAAWPRPAAQGRSSIRARPGAGPALGGPLALALAGMGVLVLAIAPGGGWPRDWDDATGLATVVSLASAGALAAGGHLTGGARTLAPTVLIALGASIALWGVHASETIGLRRVDALLASRSIWSDFTRANAYDILGAAQMNAGRLERAAGYFSRAIECAPNPRYFHQLGLVELARGRLEAAENEFRRSIARNRAVSDPWAGLAQVALARGDTAGAIANADSALARSRQNVEARRLRALLGAHHARGEP